MSQPPKKNSGQWVKNEKIINENPALKQARDIREGIEKPGRHYKQTHGGKGSALRTPNHTKEWADAYDQIDWSKTRNEKKNYRTKVNGKYIDEE